jgi:DNA-binding HxlR family transcriptional regulator
MKTTIPTLSEQLRDGNLFAEQCPSREVLKHAPALGVLILLALRQGTHRFSDLRRKMGGVSERCCPSRFRRWSRTGLSIAYRTRLCRRT